MIAESMAKTVETCCRPGSPLEHDPVLILVQSGPLHSAHPVINLCPSCAGSMTRCFARGQRSRPADRASKPTGRSDGPSHRRRHRRRSRRKRRALSGCLNSAFLDISRHFSTFYGPSVQAMDTQLGARQRRRPPTVHRGSTHAPRLQRPVASEDEASACSELRRGCHPETPVIESCRFSDPG